MRAILFSSQQFDFRNSQPAPLAQAQPAQSCTLDDTMLLPQHVAKQHPAFAVESRKLDLLDRVKVGRAGVDPDPREEH
jgi:hypothetical protein